MKTIKSIALQTEEIIENMTAAELRCIFAALDDSDCELIKRALIGKKYKTVGDIIDFAMHRAMQGELK